MADTVRYFMEEMVPELEDLEEKGYFSKAEIRDILRKRENFEYALKRKTPAKADFLRYIEYETSLDELMKLRKVSQSIKSKPGKGELGTVKRCHMLFERATRKFRGDTRLWLNWMEYCKASNSTRQMSRVITKALQMHPKDVGLWIYAAAWEFEHNKNTGGARSLMQQALRINKDSKQLWAEYLRMELVYAQKLRARQKILGITKEEGSRPEEEEQLMKPAKDDKADLDIVIRGAVARVVLKNALESIPDSQAFRLTLLEILEEVSLPGIEALASDLFKDLEKNFGGSEEAWEMSARRCLGQFAATSPLSPEEAAATVYEAAVKSLPTPRMFDFYAAFLLAQAGWSKAVQEGSAPPQIMKKSRQRKAARKCLAVYERAAEKGALSEEAAQVWPRLALACGKVTEALSAAETGAARHKNSAALWSQLIVLASQKAQQQGAETRPDDLREAVQALVLRAVTNAVTDSDDTEKLWDLAFRSVLELGLDLGPLITALQQQISQSGKGPLMGGLGAAAGAAGELVKQEMGLQAFRNFYQALLQLPAAGGSFFHSIIDAELSEEQDRLPNPKIKSLFEKAVEAYGKLDTDLWIKYARFVQQQGQGTSKMHWRATKELADASSFTAIMSASSP